MSERIRFWSLVAFLLLVIIVGISALWLNYTPWQEDAEVACVTTPTATFGQGMPESMIIKDAAICRLLINGHTPEQIGDNPFMVAAEAREITAQFLRGEVTLSNLRWATMQLCASNPQSH